MNSKRRRPSKAAAAGHPRRGWEWRFEEVRLHRGPDGLWRARLDLMPEVVFSQYLLGQQLTQLNAAVSGGAVRPWVRSAPPTPEF